MPHVRGLGGLALKRVCHAGMHSGCTYSLPHLIGALMDPDRLCRMYVGWAAWL